MASLLGLSPLTPHNISEAIVQEYCYSNEQLCPEDLPIALGYKESPSSDEQGKAWTWDYFFLFKKDKQNKQSSSLGLPKCKLQI